LVIVAMLVQTWTCVAVARAMPSLARLKAKWNWHAVAKRRLEIRGDVHRREADAALHDEGRVAARERVEEALHRVVRVAREAREEDDAGRIDVLEANPPVVRDQARSSARLATSGAASTVFAE